MSRLKLCCVLTAGLLAQRLVAEERAAMADAEVPTLQTSTRIEQRAGRETIRHACFALGPNKFAFVIPPGFRMDTAGNDKVVLVTSDFSCLISVRIVPAASLEARREAVLEQYPGAKILEELSVSAASQSGPAFDLQCSTSGVPRTARVAFIPSPAGILEFTLLSQPGQFRARKSDFDFLLLTLRVGDANQELKVIQFGDQS